MLDMHRLRLLRELKHRGTLAAVAKALSYSPSAISQHLAILESEAGVPLLEHVGRRVRLTVQGEILVGHAEALLERLERAEADLGASISEVAGIIRVASLQTAALALMPPALSWLRERHPALRVEFTQIDPETSLSALVARDFELVISEEYPGRPKPRQRDVEQEDLIADTMRLAAPGDHAGAALSDLADVPWVMEPKETGAREWATALCRDAGFEPDVRFESTDLLLHVRLVATGHAAALLPDLVWADGRRPHNLRPLPGNPARRIFTAVRRGSARQPAARALREALLEALKN